MPLRTPFVLSGKLFQRVSEQRQIILICILCFCYEWKSDHAFEVKHLLDQNLKSLEPQWVVPRDRNDLLVVISINSIFNIKKLACFLNCVSFWNQNHSKSAFLPWGLSIYPGGGTSCSLTCSQSSLIFCRRSQNGHYGTSAKGTMGRRERENHSTSRSARLTRDALRSLMFNCKDFIRDKGDDWTGYTVILPPECITVFNESKDFTIWGIEKKRKAIIVSKRVFPCNLEYCS